MWSAFGGPSFNLKIVAAYLSNGLGYLKFSGRSTCSPHGDYPRMFEGRASCRKFFFHWGGWGYRYMLRILERGLQLSRGDVCGDWGVERNSACITSLFVVRI